MAAELGLPRGEQTGCLLGGIGMRIAQGFGDVGGQVGARLDQLDRVAESLTKARWQLKQAKAHAEAAELIAVNPEAMNTDAVSIAA
ncbi:hypothetical protein ACFXEL_11210 [Streptomyces sp. NPDC059382]|uniref:hypothetical protein n=1 Tax=Streptomyces sp. NPDC059382 TaxID=3346816 RepID=UPI00367D921A